MSHDNLDHRRTLHPFEAAAPVSTRDDALVDGLVAAAALVARADDWVHSAERGRLLDFLDQHRLVPPAGRAEIVEAFARTIWALREPDGHRAVIARLRRQSSHPTAALIVALGEEVASADGRIDPRECHALSLLRGALGVPPLPVP